MARCPGRKPRVIGPISLEIRMPSKSHPVNPTDCFCETCRKHVQQDQIIQHVIASSSYTERQKERVINRIRQHRVISRLRHGAQAALFDTADIVDVG